MILNNKTPSQEELNILFKYYSSKKFVDLEKNALSFTKKFPDHPLGWKALGIALKNNGKISDSLEANKRVLELSPEDVEAYNNLGNTLRELGKLEDSKKYLEHAIKLDPNFAPAHNNLGNTLKKLNIFDECIKSYNRATQLNPKYFEAYNNLGIIFREIGRLDDSENNFKKVIELNPKYAEVYYNLGITLRELGRLGEAKDKYEKAILLKPNYPQAYNNLGTVLRDLRMLDNSENSYKKAIKLNPEYADAYNNLSFTLLLKNDFKKAYDFSEWRWKSEQNFGKKFITTKPFWNGESNKKILNWKEQGIGDQIMCCSMLSELNTISNKLIVHCDKRLIPLLKRSLSKDIIYESEKKNILEKDYDAHIPMASVSKYLRKNLKSFASTSSGYLKADEKKTVKIRNNLKSNNKVKLIGISWNTKSQIPMSAFRNILLSDLASSLHGTNTKLVNLQYDDNSNEIKDLRNKLGIELLKVPEIDNKNDIDGLASLISACDLVVSIDNLTVHLAGSLGVNTKILLPYTMDSRWGIKGKESYLYSSVKLYRQTKLGNWEKVLKQLRNDL